MTNKIKLDISVVTYNRALRFHKILRNLREVAKNTPQFIDLRLLIVEDTKTSAIKSKIKERLTSIILKGTKYSYIKGSNNLGESRDIAMSNASNRGTDWIGFIDDDDYYRSDVLIVTSDALKWKGPVMPSIINFGMSGNLVESHLYRHIETKNRLKLWNDKNELGVVPSMACFINVSDWIKGGYMFGSNFPSEETSVLMAFTYLSNQAFQISKNLMFRDRSKDSLVNNLDKYSKEVIELNVNTHVSNLKRYLTNYTQFMKVYRIFKYNYGSYLSSHGAKNSEDAFIKIEKSWIKVNKSNE